jgi:hypothetical protein
MVDFIVLLILVGFFASCYGLMAVVDWLKQGEPK